MCIAHERRCKCGRKTVSFHFKDNVLSEQVVRELYCPDCSTDLRMDPATMIIDKGWAVEYDMDVAKFMGRNLSTSAITPDFLFDEGYCTWNGIYPGDHIDSVKEREAIAALAKTNPAQYLKAIKSWARDRMERLRSEGWRKAGNESVC